ncbi:hypothetical protein H8958_010736 [Nasalis larvatus]
MILPKSGTTHKPPVKHRCRREYPGACKTFICRFAPPCCILTSSQKKKTGALLTVYFPAASLWAGPSAASPSSFLLWFILPDISAHPRNPDYEESGESSSSGGSELEPSGHQLFCLEYEADSGEVTSVIVYQGDDPGKVSEEVSAHTPLDPPMREALKLRIQEEIAKRQSRH